MASKAALIEFLASTRVHPTTGIVWSGGLIGFFVPGTATGKAIWLDRDKTLPTGAGQETGTLGTDGSFTAFGDGVYDVKIYDASDTLLGTPLKTYSSVNLADATTSASLTDPSFLDGTDPSKIATWDQSGITTATTRTIAMPDVSGEMLVNGSTIVRADTASPYNTFFGSGAGPVSTGLSNTGLGYNAMLSTTTGVSNIAIGRLALRDNVSGSSNIAIGSLVLSSATVSGNVGIGASAMANTTTGDSNVAVGLSSLTLNTEGTDNVAVGQSAAQANTTGSHNSCVGELAGGELTTGDNNLLLGRNSGRTGTPSGAITTESHRIALGDNNITNAYIKVAWTVTSDGRDKADVADFSHGLDYIDQIQPKTYVWDERSNYEGDPDGSKKKDKVNTGFIAQDLLTVEEDLGILGNGVVDIEDLDNLRITETKLIPILVNAVKELSARVKQLEGA